MITAEVAIYPLKTNDAASVINSSIDVLQQSNANFDVNSMNTRIKGTKAEVFTSLETMFSEAENKGGEVSMVVTITNAT
ncbi:MAG: YkoF family thiamine/hydroxymethylpyrimidine-binding protein [Clostridiales bacterium]|jgi:uncharacterized protein YqgV (UPF0045/DUF77 family)|nr:Ykof family thiamine-binding protein [Eubacteriales bacterium]MDH7566777.1 YkoF family thiamine/hydroxymethylpyrimidine-binding protein [Clostridiales bacterium]